MEFARSQVNVLPGVYEAKNSVVRFKPFNDSVNYLQDYEKRMLQRSIDVLSKYQLSKSQVRVAGIPVLSKPVGVKAM